MRRSLTLVGLVVGISVLGAAPAFAHGVGGRQDLPLSLDLFIGGASAAIIVSFVLLGFLWTTPRLQDGVRHRELPGGPLVAVLGAVLSLLGLAWLVAIVVDGFVGDGRGSLSPLLVWIVFWLVVPFLSAVFGNLYTPFSPWRVLGKLFGSTGRTHNWGVWPATIALFAFTWLELIPAFGGEPATLAAVVIGYSMWLLAWMFVFGADTGLQTADAFTSYNRVISAIAPFGRQDGKLVWRGWLRALPQLPNWPGLTWFVLVMIGTVTYDGLSAAPIWRTWFGDLAFNQAFNTMAMAAIVGLIGLGYFGASAAAAKLSEMEISAGEVADSFAHTLVPIGLAYAFAHYFTLIVFEGQLLISAASDPWGLGTDLFGTTDRAIDFTVLPITSIWWIQLVAIVAGHIAGVVLAHDRALALFPARTAVRTQWAMLALMVALTGLGLFILAEG